MGLAEADLADFAGREVLVVDDDEDSRTLVAGALSRVGLVVRTAESAERAFESCALRVPSVIVMDVWMPGRNGIQACQRLRAQRETAEVPIILMSAQWRDEDQLFEALDSGANDVLAKERRGIELLARVRSALELSRVRSDLESSERELHDLRQLLAICAACKQVRNDKGEWESVEVFLRRHTDRELTHGICPECREKLYGAVQVQRT